MCVGWGLWQYSVHVAEIDREWMQYGLIWPDDT